MVKEIIVDEEKLGERSDEINIRKENALMRQIILDLKDTLREYKNGVGLAAPQIGYNKRIFVINFNGDLRSFVNPIISNVKGFTLNREGCLSIPGKEYIRPRHPEIQVIYQTPLGKTESRKIIGAAAYVFQHELDHLDGTLLSDVGLEVLPEFDSASEEEKEEVIKKYLESLDVKQKEIQKEIDEDKELKETASAINFIEKLQKGEIEVQSQEVDTKTKKKIEEKVKKMTK